MANSPPSPCNSVFVYFSAVVYLYLFLSLAVHFRPLKVDCVVSIPPPPPSLCLWQFKCPNKLSLCLRQKWNWNVQLSQLGLEQIRLMCNFASKGFSAALKSWKALLAGSIQLWCFWSFQRFGRNKSLSYWDGERQLPQSLTQILNHHCVECF